MRSRSSSPPPAAPLSHLNQTSRDRTKTTGKNVRTSSQISFPTFRTLTGAKLYPATPASPAPSRPSGTNTGTTTCAIPSAPASSASTSSWNAPRDGLSRNGSSRSRNGPRKSSSTPPSSTPSPACSWTPTPASRKQTFPQPSTTRSTHVASPSSRQLLELMTFTFVPAKLRTITPPPAILEQVGTHHGGATGPGFARSTHLSPDSDVL